LHRSPGYKRFRRHDEFEGGRRGAAVEETGRLTTGFLGDGRYLLLHLLALSASDFSDALLRSYKRMMKQKT
jgi:hypothetical protein